MLTLPAGAALAREAAPSRATAPARVAFILIDINASTAAARLSAERDQALAFAHALSADVQVGLIAFADTWRMVLRPTTSRSALAAALALVKPTGGTSDGIRQALSGAVAEIGRHGASAHSRILVLSNAETLGKPVPAPSVPVDVIASTYDADDFPATLRALATASGGTIGSATDVTALAAAFPPLQTPTPTPHATRSTTPATGHKPVLRPTHTLGGVLAVVLVAFLVLALIGIRLVRQGERRAPPVVPERLLRRRIVLMSVTLLLILVAAASATFGWVGGSGLLFWAGTGSVILILILLGLLVYLQRVAAGQTAGSTTAAPVSQIPHSSPGSSTVARAVSPLTSTEPSAQRKDFRRRQHRPLISHHGACSLEQAGTDHLFILAGSVLGARHDQAGITREDSVAFAAEPTSASAVVAAVADGLGSARLSHLASALAVRRAIDMLSLLLAVEPHQHGIIALPDWSRVADQLVARLADELAEPRVLSHRADLGMPPAAEESSNRRARPATTLAVLAVADTAAGICISWLTVGDCEVAVVDVASREVKWLTPRATRDSQITDAVPPMRRASCSGQVSLADGQAVLAMTDGMAEMVDAEPEHVLRALAAARRKDNAMRDLLVALDLRLQGVHDDRSMVAVGPIYRG